MSVKNHADDPKGEKLELWPRDGRTAVKVGPMMTGGENERCERAVTPFLKSRNSKPDGEAVKPNHTA